MRLSAAPLYFHRVQEGQSLGDIAANYGIDANALQALNPEVTEAAESHSAPIFSSPVVVIDMTKASATL